MHLAQIYPGGSACILRKGYTTAQKVKSSVKKSQIFPPLQWAIKYNFCLFDDTWNLRIYVFFRWLSPLMFFFGYIEPNIEFDVSIFTIKIFVCKVKRSPPFNLHSPKLFLEKSCSEFSNLRHAFEGNELTK